MSDGFDFDDIFNVPASSLKRKSGSSKIGGSMNWNLLTEQSASSPDKRTKATAASKAVAAINEVSELASPTKKFLGTDEMAVATPCVSMNSGIEPEKRLGRVGHVAVEVNGKLYVHGGETDNGTTLGDILVLDIASGTTTTLLCESPSRAWHSANFLSDKQLLLVFGGERSATDDAQNAFIDEPLVLDTSINLWYPPTISGKGPGPRAGHTGTIIRENVVVFIGGRRRSVYISSVFYLDTSRWHWMIPVIEGKPPRPRAHHTCSTISGNRVVLFGGSDDFRCFNDVHCLKCDQKAQNWEWIQPEVQGTAPPARTGHTAVVVDERFVIISGGYDPFCESVEPKSHIESMSSMNGNKNFFEDEYVMDTATWTWSIRPQPTVLRFTTNISNLHLCNDSESTEFDGCVFRAAVKIPRALLPQSVHGYDVETPLLPDASEAVIFYGGLAKNEEKSKTFSFQLCCNF